MISPPSPSLSNPQISTIWLDRTPKKYYVRLFSQSDYTKVITACQMCGGFAKDSFALHSNAVNLGIGRMCGLLCFWDLAITAVKGENAKNKRFTERENGMLGALKLEKHRELKGTSHAAQLITLKAKDSLLTEAMEHYSKVLACTEVKRTDVEKIERRREQEKRGAGQGNDDAG